MKEAEHDAYVTSVWRTAAARGVEGGAAVRGAYLAMLVALADAGAAPEVAARFLERQIGVALAQYGVLLGALELASDALSLTVDLSNDLETMDPVTLGYHLVKQKAGLAILHDEIARLAPYADVATGWDRAETARERRAAEAERDGFLAEVTEVAERALADEND